MTPSWQNSAMPIKVPLVDLQAQYRPLRDEILSAMTRVCDSQRFIMGPEIAALEDELARMLGIDHAVAVSSGTDALLLALMTLGVGPGDEVITSAHSFFATAGAIVRVGARPIFVDIDPETFNIDAAGIAAAVTSRTKASPAGASVRPERRSRSDRRSRLAGGRPGRRRCRAGDRRDVPVAARRWHRHDRLLLVLPEQEPRRLRRRGPVDDQRRRHRRTRAAASNPRHGAQVLPSRRRRELPDGCAAGRRSAREGPAAGRVDRGEAVQRGAVPAPVSRAGCEGPLKLPAEPPDRRHIFNQFVIRTPGRDALKRHLDEAGIGNEIYYPVPLPLQPCFARLGYRRGDFPHAERAANESLAIPIYAELNGAQQQAVVDAIAGFLHKSPVPTGRWSRCRRGRAVTQAEPEASSPRSRLPGLTTQILIGLLLGIAVGYRWPSFGVAVKPLADAFLRLIKMIVVPLVFSTLVVGIAGSGNLRTMGRIGLKAIIYFEAATTIALFLGLGLANVFKPGAGLGVSIGADTSAVTALSQNQQHGWDIFLHLFPTSVVDAMARGDVLQVVVFSTFFGLAVAAIGARGRPVIEVLDSTAVAMFKVTGYVMTCAPIGVFAAIAATVGGRGLAVLFTLGKLVALMYLGLAMFVLIVLGTVSYLIAGPVLHLCRSHSRTVPDRVHDRQLGSGAAESVRGDGAVWRAEEHRRLRPAGRLQLQP